MSKLLEALIKLGQKLNGTAPTGETVDEVIDNIADDYSGGGGGTDTKVTACNLTKESGVITGGTITLSDGTTVNITVTGD